MQGPTATGISPSSAGCRCPPSIVQTTPARWPLLLVQFVHRLDRGGGPAPIDNHTAAQSMAVRRRLSTSFADRAACARQSARVPILPPHPESVTATDHGGPGSWGDPGSPPDSRNVLILPPAPSGGRSCALAGLDW